METCRHEWELLRESAYADGRKVTRLRCQLCPEEMVERTQATGLTVSGDFKDFSLVAATRLGVMRWI